MYVFFISDSRCSHFTVFILDCCFHIRYFSAYFFRIFAEDEYFQVSFLTLGCASTTHATDRPQVKKLPVVFNMLLIFAATFA